MYFIGKLYNLEVSEYYKITDKVAKVNRLITNKEVLHQSKFLFLAATSKLIKGLAAPKRGIL